MPGAADAPRSIGPDELRDSIRPRLHAGTLPRATGQAWIQPATGDQRCAPCGGQILARTLACTVRDRVELHAHASCYKVWVEESRRRGQPPAPSTRETSTTSRRASRSGKRRASA